MELELKCYKTYEDIKLPEFATDGSACFDLAFQMAGKWDYTVYAPSNKPITRQFSNNMLRIMPGERVLVPTGLIFDIPPGFSLRIHARSGLALKKGLVLANAEGVIDSDYVDETFIMLYNMSTVSASIENGERIAQAELVPVISYLIMETKDAPRTKTNRKGGLGSTGTKPPVKKSTRAKAKTDVKKK